MHYPFKFGDYNGWVIRDGGRQIPGEHFFSAADLRAFGLAEDAEMEFSLNCLLVKAPDDRLILVDTGLGRDVGGNEGRLFLGLKQAGVAPETIDMVIITHGHWDHIGGLTTLDGAERFPNARLLMPQKEWDYWTDPSILERLDGPVKTWAEDVLPKVSHRMETYEPGDTLRPGITAFDLAGHTIGQCGLEISSKGQCFYVIADAIHQPFQFHAPQHSPGVDDDVQISSRNRQRLVDNALKEKALILGYHFPYPGLGTLTMGDEGVEWDAKMAL